MYVSKIIFNSKVNKKKKKINSTTSFIQGSQYRISGYTDLASGMIYFGYWSILVYRFGFTTIIYIYIYISKDNIY